MGLAAAETADPGKNVPKAIRSVFWRILLFYIGAIFVAGTLIPYTDPNLLNADESHIAYSPFTMVLQQLPTVRLLRVQPHERGDSLLGAVVRKLIHVRGIAHAACDGPQPQSAANVRHAECTRACRSLALLATGSVSAMAFFSTMVGDKKIYQLLLQRLELERISDLAGNRHLPSCDSARHGWRRAAAWMT